MAKKTRKKSSPGLDAMSTEALQAELARRQRSIASLERKRDRLQAQLEAVEAEIAEAGGSIRMTSNGRSRARNSQSLADALAGVLQGKTMSVTEVADAVQRAGYQTTSDNFRTIVNQTLLQNKNKKFKKVARGQYTAK
ncbi:MAG: hypothetical protein AAF747_05660 [Planctomycetota bacterium]